MESYRAQLQAKLSWKFVQMTRTSLSHKWAATENSKPVSWDLELVAFIEFPGDHDRERFPKDSCSDFLSGSERPVWGQLGYSGVDTHVSLSVSKYVERKI